MSLPRRMQAARITEFNTPYEITQVDLPVPQEWQLLLKTQAAGYCHTDAMVQQGRSPFGAISPITGSHEPSGVVVQLGKKAQELGTFKEGDRVVALATIGVCQECSDCLQFGDSYCSNITGAVGMSCDGAFAEYCIVDARSSAIVPKSMSFSQACPLACAGTTIYTAIKRTQIQPGQVLGIVGLGALGMLGIQMSVQMGFKTVGVDSRSEPVALAKSVMGSKTGDCRFLQSSVGLEEARRVVRDLDQDRVWDGVDAVILATDALESVEYATSLVKKHGTFVLLGSPNPLQFSARELIHQDIRIIGSLMGGRKELQECIDLCASNHIQSHLTTWRLQDINEMVEVTHSPSRRGKHVVVFD